ncbi:MAG: SDR family oxidoreductase [Rhizobiales bacterium]|nr:SDR family oxidoreductase [Hyphomicrobiales bacterium]
MDSQPAMQLLVGRHAVVTGAAGSIGRAITSVFRQHGAQVTALDVRPADGIVPADVTDEAALRDVVDGLAQPTDIVHAAGAILVGPLERTTVDEFRAAVESNLLSAFVVGRVAAGALRSGGTLTFVSSQAGFRGAANWGVYCAVKAGVLRLAEAFAQELGPRGIRVNTVCPGTVETPMTDVAVRSLSDLGKGSVEAVHSRYLSQIPLGRYADPAEIGEVCAFLASRMASYLSGASIPIDGGEVSA